MASTSEVDTYVEQEMNVIKETKLYSVQMLYGSASNISTRFLYWFANAPMKYKIYACISLAFVVFVMYLLYAYGVFTNDTWMQITIAIIIGVIMAVMHVYIVVYS
jgi:hypothetical protein